MSALCSPESALSCDWYAVSGSGPSGVLPDLSDSKVGLLERSSRSV